MKITPVKDYKKPVFAIGIAAAMALSVTACKDPVVQLDGDVVTVETTEEVQIDGEVAIDQTDATCETSGTCDTSGTSSPDETIQLDGVIDVAD